MKISEFSSKGIADLNNELINLKKTQFGLRLRHRTQQFGNTAQLKSVRRDIARIKTFISQKL